jgi:hypothetical protein
MAVALVQGMNGFFTGLMGVAMVCFSSLAVAEGAVGAVVADPSDISRGARDDLTSVNPPPQRETLPAAARRWYGWQALTVDGGAMALSLAAFASATSDAPRNEGLTGGLLVAGMIGYGAGAPAIHLLHDRPWHALGSFGLRGSLPVVGGALGLAAATCPPPNGDYGNCGASQLLAGAVAGAVLAMLIDDSLLAWDRPHRDAKPQARLGLTPVVSIDGSRELRVYGTF